MDTAHYYKTCRTCGAEFLTNDWNTQEDADCDPCFDELHADKPSVIERIDNWIDAQIEDRGI